MGCGDTVALRGCVGDRSAGDSVGAAATGWAQCHVLLEWEPTCVYTHMHTPSCRLCCHRGPPGPDTVTCVPGHVHIEPLRRREQPPPAAGPPGPCGGGHRARGGEGVRCVWGPRHRVPLPRHDLRGLQGLLQVGAATTVGHRVAQDGGQGTEWDGTGGNRQDGMGQDRMGKDKMG